MEHSIKTIVEETGAQYRTVQRWVKKASGKAGYELGRMTDRTRYFTNEEKELIVAEQSTKAKTKAEDVYEVEIVDDYELEDNESNPTLPSSVNLAKFRGGNALSTDTSQLNQALGLTQQIANLMDSDIEERWKSLEETKAAAQQLKQAQQDLAVKTLTYQLETRILSRLQETENKVVKEELGKLQDLGN